jgi:hypothetical protein
MIRQVFGAAFIRGSNRTSLSIRSRRAWRR